MLQVLRAVLNISIHFKEQTLLTLSWLANSLSDNFCWHMHRSSDLRDVLWASACLFAFLDTRLNHTVHPVLMKFQQGCITVPTTRMCDLHHLQTATSQDKPAPYNEDPDNCGSHYLRCFLRPLGFKIAGILQDTL